MHEAPEMSLLFCRTTGARCAFFAAQYGKPNNVCASARLGTISCGVAAHVAHLELCQVSTHTVHSYSCMSLPSEWHLTPTCNAAPLAVWQLGARDSLPAASVSFTLAR